MPDAAQYTLALFDTTALGWTVDVPHAPAPSAEPVPPLRPTIDAAPPAPPVRPLRGTNYVLAGERTLSRGWLARARDNIRAVKLSKEIEDKRGPLPQTRRLVRSNPGWWPTHLQRSGHPRGRTDAGVFSISLDEERARQARRARERNRNRSGL